MTKIKPNFPKIEYGQLFLDMLMDSTLDYIYFKDRESRFIRISKSHARLFGLNDPAEAIGKTDFDFLNYEHAFQAFQDEHTIINTGESIVNSEEKEVWPDGSITWASSTKVPLCNSDGEIIGTFGISRDITKRKLAEEALTNERIMLKSILDNIPDQIYVKDVQSRFVIVNSAVTTRTITRSSEDLIGKSDFDLFPPEYAQQYFEDEQKLMNTGIPLINHEEQIINNNTGEVGWNLTSKIPFKDQNGNLLGLIGVNRDITERVMAEHALQKSEEKLSTLFSSMTEMVVIHELVFDELGNPVNYRITDCNKAFTNITGVTRDAAIGKLADELYNTDIPPYIKEFCNVGISGEPYHFETHFAPMDKYLSISVVSVGKNKFATITADITPFKQIQQIIAAKNKELEQIIYVASHDLRSPLVNVDGYSRELEYSINEIMTMLADDNHLENDIVKFLKIQLPDMVESLKFIRNGTRQMDALLKGLLKLSRLGRAALNICPINVNELVASITANMEYQIKAINAEIHIAELPPCKGDVVQLTQVFANLIGNALKYNNKDRKTVINITGIKKRHVCVYCVEDNGIGIDQRHHERIFELFHRLNPSRTEGEGLGLTIVRQILNRLDGDIQVESTLGEGSRFYISLPYSRI